MWFNTLPEAARVLVVVSFYDQMPVRSLNALLTQTEQVPSGHPFDRLLVCNRTRHGTVDLDESHRGIDRIDRENAGLNIGAWQSGWRARPDYDVYLFVQDECVLNGPNWLAPFVREALRPSTGFVGESLNSRGSWAKFAARYPSIAEACLTISRGERVPLGGSPAHLQSLVVAARREVLERTGGFITRDEKVAAMGAEVMSSVRARHHGYANRQLAPRPFEHISHPQWETTRTEAASLAAHAKRVARRPADVATLPALLSGLMHRRAVARQERVVTRQVGRRLNAERSYVL